MATIGTDIAKAKEILTGDDLVGIPTETVYGLAGNALSEIAIAKIFEVKNRPRFDPLIAHTDQLDKMIQYLDHVPAKAQKMADLFWPGPLTLLLPKNNKIPDLLTSGLPDIAVRIPNHPITLQLLAELDFPLGAPSANPFGYVSPTCAQHVNDQLENEISYILDGGSCAVGIESTIVGFENEDPVIYRLGGIEAGQIETQFGQVKIKLNKSSNPIAPGMYKTHYSPRKNVVLGNIQYLIEHHTKKKIGVISFGEISLPQSITEHIILSKNRDLKEAARNLFSALRNLDNSDIDLIIAEKLPETGLGLAINDRLQRAAVS